MQAHGAGIRYYNISESYGFRDPVEVTVDDYIEQAQVRGLQITDIVATDSGIYIEGEQVAAATAAPWLTASSTMWSTIPRTPGSCRLHRKIVQVASCEGRLIALDNYGVAWRFWQNEWKHYPYLPDTPDPWELLDELQADELQEGLSADGATR